MSIDLCYTQPHSSLTKLRSKHQFLAREADRLLVQGTSGLLHLQVLILRIYYSLLQHKANAAVGEWYKAFEMARHLKYTENPMPKKAMAGSLEDDITVAEAEGRRRAFWAIYCLDVQLALLVGKPRHWHNGACTGVDRPDTRSEKELLSDATYKCKKYHMAVFTDSWVFLHYTLQVNSHNRAQPFIQVADIHRIHSYIANQLHMLHHPLPMGTSLRVRQMNTMQPWLNWWILATAYWKKCQKVCPSDSQELLDRQAEALILAYCQAIIVMYKPFLLMSLLLLSEERGRIVVFDQNKEDLNKGLKQALEASLITIRIVYDMNRDRVRLDAVSESTISGPPLDMWLTTSRPRPTMHIRPLWCFISALYQTRCPVMIGHRISAMRSLPRG